MRKKGFRKAPDRRGKFALKREERPYATVAYTPQFARVSLANKNLVLNTYKFILRNFGLIGAVPLIDKRTGVSIERDYTGTYAGGESTTYRAKHRGKSFFIKLIPAGMEQNTPNAYLNAQRLFKLLNYRIGRYRIGLIKPHLIFTPRNADLYSVVVTDFYEEKDVMHLDHAGISENDYKKKI